MTRTRLFACPSFLFCCLFYSFICSLGAHGAEPLRVGNMGPFHAAFGTQAPLGSTVLKDGQSRWGVHLDAASYLAEYDDAHESVRIDGETYRTSLSFRRGFGEQFEAYFDLPVLMHTGGVFDNFIEEWHEVFSLPQGGRDSAPQDRLAVHYAMDGRPLTHIDTSERAFGDLVVGLGYAVPKFSERLHGVALRAELQLPTGDERRLTGVEKGAFKVTASTSGNVPWGGSSSAWSWFASLGAGIAGIPEPLAELDTRPTWQAGFGIAWRALSRLELIAQADYKSSPYDGASAPQLADASLLLAFGGRLSLGRDWQFEMAVVEDDGSRRAAADVGLRLALIRAPRS